MKSHLASAIVLFASTACASAPPPEPSGFLGTRYAELQLDRETGALMYVEESADLGRYSRVMLDRVQVWVDTENRYKGASWMDVRRVAEMFQAAVRDALESGYPIVDEPAADVLRIRLAVTGVQADVDGYSTRENLGYGDPETVDEISETGTNLRIDTISVEAEFLDSTTDERLVAAVVRRSAAPTKGRTSWDVVGEVFDQLAQRVRAGLDRAHGSESR